MGGVDCRCVVCFFSVIALIFHTAPLADTRHKLCFNGAVPRRWDEWCSTLTRAGGLNDGECALTIPVKWEYNSLLPGMKVSLHFHRKRKKEAALNVPKRLFMFQFLCAISICPLKSLSGNVGKSLRFDWSSLITPSRCALFELLSPAVYSTAANTFMSTFILIFTCVIFFLYTFYTLLGCNRCAHDK